MHYTTPLCVFINRDWPSRVFLYQVALSFKIRYLYHGVVYTKRDNSHKETLWLDTLHVGSCADLEGNGGWGVGFPGKFKLLKFTE